MLNKKLAVVALMVAFPVGAMAGADGGCGVGSKLFDGQKGTFPQVFAMTTNNWSFNTFAVTSGTSGCDPDGTVKSNWKMALFIDGNKDKLARDMSTGQGETLDVLAGLIGISEDLKPVFFRTAKDNFARIYTSNAVTTEQIIASLKNVLATDGELAKYSASI